MSTHIAPQHSLPPGPWPVAHVETAHCALPHFDNALLSHHNNANVLYNVDRFNYCLPDTLNNADFYYVYIHNFPQNKPGGFNYLRLCRTSGRITVYVCDSHPIGALWVCDTFKLCIYPMFSNLQYCQMKREADRAFHNYRQDCFIRHHYGISYECYLTGIIDALVAIQDFVDRYTDTDLGTYIDHKKVHSDDQKVRKTLDNLDSYNLDTKWQGTANSDINYPDKGRGYIALQPTDFRFIGPDRPGIDTSNLDLYLKVAGTVRQSGLPNYRQVRIPINLGLNIQVWQRHFSDYGDQLLVQYLQYGFPLSIRDPDMLVMQDVKNHYSALQHHESVASYLTKEKALGAIMGPILNWAGAP